MNCGFGFFSRVHEDDDDYYDMLFILASLLNCWIFKSALDLLFKLLYLNKMEDLCEIVVNHRKLYNMENIFKITLFFMNYEINICFVPIFWFGFCCVELNG